MEDEEENEIEVEEHIMEAQIKCPVEEHKGMNAIKFCPECKIFLCNKCENFHAPLFKNHHPYTINKDEEIFTGICKEKNHSNKLEYYCKNHNQLCCLACIAKLNENGIGQHRDCEIFSLEKIEDQKKNELKENIKSLEELENKFIESIELIKKLLEDTEKDKDNIKLEIQNIFTKIRTILNEREDFLMKEVDKTFNKVYFNEDIIKKGEKLPKLIKSSLEKGKSIDKIWDNNNLNSYINDCINIENDIKNINIINESINKIKNRTKIIIRFKPNGYQLGGFLKTIKLFGEISFNVPYSLRECPINISENRKYVVTGFSNNILTKTVGDEWVGTISENELDKKIEEHKWKIKILKTTKNKNIMIGLAPSDFDINTSNYNTCGWYFYCYDLRLYSGPPFNRDYFRSNLSKIKDEVVVVMNMKKRTLKFIINNEDIGDSYTNIPIDKPLFPAIFLYNKDDSVKIMNFDK